DEARAIEPEIAEYQTAWERSLAARKAFDWTPDAQLLLDLGFDDRPAGTAAPSIEPRYPCGRPRSVAGPVGSAIILEEAAYLDAGDIAAFGFYDKFTLSAWIKPDGPRGGTIISRVVDEPEADGYSVGTRGGKIQVNLVKRWLDDAIRVQTTRTVSANRWTHLAISYDGSRVASGIKIYVDGQLAP